jgi:adenosylcobinamide amidohydrolase
MRPFANNRQEDFHSAVWEGLVIRCRGDHLSLEPPVCLDGLSNAVYGGGRTPAKRIVNWQVPRDYSGIDPVQDLAERLDVWGYSHDEVVGLQTAAVIAGASVQEEAGDGYRLSVCVTSGTGNAARAGVGRETYPAYSAGTINTAILIDGRLTFPAMLNALITATEAKAAALQDSGILDPVSGRSATGTTTDVVVIGVSQAAVSGPVHTYAGTATTIGDAIGRLVYTAIHEATRQSG